MPDFPLCLGIETSCDETALALVRGGHLLASVLASQADVHAIFGGVVPEVASREHLRLLGPLLDILLERAGMPLSQMDIIAVTRGPGLLGSLLVGVAFAKALALGLARPIIAINHLHAHLLACGLDQPMIFPSLGLVVSGGHTEIYFMESTRKFTRLGRSLDDAAGEVLDKTGQILGLPYPAGRAIDEHAQAASRSTGSLPRPYLNNINLDFSFSGLKTAAINLAVELDLPGNTAALPGLCRELTAAIAETLAVKLKRALSLYPHITRVYMAGGVAASTSIRQYLQAALSPIPLICPLPALCGDNAAMVAHAGSLLGADGFHHDLNFEAIPRGRVIPEDAISDRKTPHQFA